MPLLLIYLSLSRISPHVSALIRALSCALNGDSDVSDGSRSIHGRTGTSGPSSGNKNVLPPYTCHFSAYIYVCMYMCVQTED